VPRRRGGGTGGQSGVRHGPASGGPQRPLQGHPPDHGGARGRRWPPAPAPAAEGRSWAYGRGVPPRRQRGSHRPRRSAAVGGDGRPCAGMGDEPDGGIHRARRRLEPHGARSTSGLPWDPQECPPDHSFIAPIYAPHSRGGVTDYMKGNLVFARRGLMAIGAPLMAVVLFSWPSIGAPGGQASDLFPLKWLPAPEQFDLSSSGMSGAGGQFSTQQIERFTCTTSGPPTAGVIMNCNVPEFNQNFSPDNEIAVVVDPDDPNHIVA